MDYGLCDRRAEEGSPPPYRAIKILLAGGFGVGKTTLVGAVSEIKPLRTEESITSAQLDARPASRPRRRRRSRWTSAGSACVPISCSISSVRPAAAVLVHVGRTCDRRPGGRGARRYPAAGRQLPAIDYVERRQIPFIVALNCFAGSRRYDLQDVRTPWT